jgi:deazaflavin-dependent oxidoreductase (nitroreductase family)
MLVPVDPHVRRALAHGGICDITTTGRRSGEPRRIELVYHVIEGRIYISGMPRPRKRAWLLNLEADPRMTVHLEGTIAADLPATARPIDDEAERRRVLGPIARAWRRTDVEAMVRFSPLIEVVVDGLA